MLVVSTHPLPVSTCETVYNSYTHVRGVKEFDKQIGQEREVGRSYFSHMAVSKHGTKRYSRSAFATKLQKLTYY